MKKLSLTLLCFLLAANVFAQKQRIIPTAGASVTGTVSAIDGNRILLFDGRIALDATGATIRTLDGPATLDDITVGERIMATVDPMNAGGDLRARQIQILEPSDASLHGTVESVDVDAGTIRVLGQTIRITGSTILRGFRGMPLASLAEVLPGQEVRVEFERNAPGLTARVLMVMAPMGGIHSAVVGIVDSIDNNVWTIRSEGRTLQIIATDQTQIIGTPRAGDRVLINYRTDASGQHFALSIALAPEGPRPPQRVIRGVVLEITDTTLRVETRQGSIIIVHDELTTFHGGRPAVGDSVHVYLRNSPLTIFIADRVVKVAGDENRIVFVGTVFSINDNVWDIEGMKVIITANTKFINSPGLGDRVHVIATQNSQGTFGLEIETVF